jgi:tetratricopeptide (TPR) repeat protein
MQERVPSIEVVRPGLPQQVVNVVEKSLAKVPADRFATADDFIKALLAPVTSAELRLARAVDKRLMRRTLTAALALVSAVVAWLVLRPPAAILDSNKIVVFPLEERGFPEGENGAGYDIALMIGAALEHTEPLKWIDGRRRLAGVARAGVDLVNLEDARNISLGRRARYFIDGVVRSGADSSTVVLRLHDVAGDSIVSQESAAAANGELNFVQLGLVAIRNLLPALLEPGRDIDISPLQDRQSSAIALWIQGEREYRQSHFSLALEFYRRAIAADSALVFAAVKGAQAASWNHHAREAEQLVNHALTHDSLLPPRYLSFARGLRGYLTGDSESAVAWLQQTIEEDPEWAEASTALGEVYYHLLPMSAALDSLAQASFATALSIDSAFAPPLYHLAEDAIRSGDSVAAYILIERFREVNPEQPLLLQLELMSRCVYNDAEMAWAGPAAGDPPAVFRAAKSLSVSGRQHRCAEGAFRALLNAEIDLAERFGAVLGLQGILVATGRGSTALSLLDSLISAGDRRARSLHVLYTLAGAPMDAEAAELAAFATGAFGQQYERLTSTLNLWVLGVWHVYQSEAEKVGTIAAALDDIANQTGLRRDRMYADALAAHEALMRGDTTDAIDRLLDLTSTGTVNSVAWGYGEALPVEHLLLAELMLADGRYVRSIRAASVFDHAGPVIFVAYLPKSLQVRYDAARSMGRLDLAEQYRERLLALGRGDLVR